MKTNEDYFADWEAHVFGYGYGSGEEYIIGALKVFMSLCVPPERGYPAYDYQELEAALTPVVAWLLINVLCNANLIEYGSSPRFGWLTKEGISLKAHIGSHDVESLCAQTRKDEYYSLCDPLYCNCEDAACNNPFWISHQKRELSL